MSIVAFNQNPELNYSLALKKIEEQDYLFAIRLLKDGIKLENNPKYYVELAELYYKLEQYDESTATYIELSNLYLSMEFALGILHSHQASLGVDIDVDKLTISQSCLFKISKRHLDNVHLNRILSKYQKKSLESEQPHLISLRDRSISRKLCEAKEYSLKGDYSKAMIILDAITDDKFLLKVLELKTIIYLGTEDYEKTILTGKKYNEKSKGNPTIARSILYAIYALNNRIITAEFRNTFNEFESEILGCGKAKALLGLYELAQMVGYKAGAEKVVKKALKFYKYDLDVLLTAIVHYASIENFKVVDRLLKRVNETFSYAPSVSFYNCLRKEIDSGNVSKEAWVSCGEESIARYYANQFCLNYLKKLKEDNSYFDGDILKSAMSYLDKIKLKELLTISEIEMLENYEELLVWGIENPYLGIEKKIILIELYISKYTNLDKIFCIPTEFGINCLNLTGYKESVFKVNKSTLYNTVYSNLILIDYNFDKKALLWSVNEFVKYVDVLNKDLICAAIHCSYFKIKNHEPHMELVAGIYQVSVDDLKSILMI